MSTFNRDRFRKKLRRLLAQAHDEPFFEMVWALDALQNGREKIASQFLRFPPEAVHKEKDIANRMHAWELESLIGQLLVIPKENKKGRSLNCKEYSAAVATINKLRALENAEAAIYLSRRILSASQSSQIALEPFDRFTLALAVAPSPLPSPGLSR